MQTSTPTNAVRTPRPGGKRARKAAAAETAGTITRMAAAIVTAIDERGDCTKADLKRAMFADAEIAAHMEPAMQIARKDPRILARAEAA